MNIICSVAFIILLVLVMLLTQVLRRNTIDPISASVPLSVAAIAFYARLVAIALREVDKGLTESALAFRALPILVTLHVLLS